MPIAAIRLPAPWHYLHPRLACCAILLALLAVLPGRAAHAAQPWREALPPVQSIGSGSMTWLGFRIYHATLWAPQRPLEQNQPFALQLDYQVRISRDKLASTSIEEIQRMSAAPIAGPTLARWKNELGRAFIDVADGDELVGVYLPQRGMRLYDRDKLLAEIADPELARAFFNIWLGQPSRDENLRRRLLGETP
ncbi:hypothetical protein J2S30_002604 [Herbaspirillum rubrisubalbicans]|uniref:chalcone isomerase family protein n=1 Tax=Herbaspirillum rubrisubalbicans TaxID=80842 RepID=UPI00209D91DF|nr:chalcone isomerase family protein [Herbaspirillum rubrisubalbicans]MCP1574225.1 hypothetical protein [Herbaspirillum rubrisubalbicans]